MADPQKFKDIKTGKIYSMKRVDGVMVILETSDGLNRIWTRSDDVNDSFQKLSEPENSQKTS
jgi:hypothetical protein